MPVQPEIKSIDSPDLEFGAQPDEPDNCCIFMEAVIGMKGQEGGDLFSLTAVTPRYLMQHPVDSWGRGYLLLSEFSWKKVEEFLEKLIHHAQRDSWHEFARELNKELHWEFENYRDETSSRP